MAGHTAGHMGGPELGTACYSFLFFCIGHNLGVSMPSRLDLDTFWVPHRIQNRIAMAAQEQLHDMLKIITPPTRNTSFEWPKGSPMAPKMTSKALQKTMPFFISRTVRNGINLAPSWPQLGAHLAATWANSGQLRINLGQLGPT